MKILKIKLNLTSCIRAFFFGLVFGSIVWIVENMKLPLLWSDYRFWIALPVVVIVSSYLFSLIPWGYITSSGIRTFNTLGIIKTLEWDGITQAKYRNLVGFTFVCLYSEHSKFAIWLPLQIKKLDKLEEIINNSVKNTEFLKVWGELKLNKQNNLSSYK